MKKLMVALNKIKLIRYSLMSEDRKITYLRALRTDILNNNRLSKALDTTGELERSFMYSSIAWLQMSEYCMYCKKEGLDVRVTFKKDMK